jgi:DHA3 family macrolide efflux protein-like MFS transporter
VRVFLRLWAGQSVSLVGSTVTSFALSVWVYQQTGSVTQLGIVYLLVFLPGILVAPVTGALVDRLDRRTVLLATTTAGLLVVLTLAGLHSADLLRPWHVYVTTAVTSMLTAVGTPAVGATVGLLVGREQLGRANGLVMLAQSVAQIVGPLAGGFLLATVQLSGLILLDALSFVVALACLLSVRLPRPAAPERDQTLLADTGASWRYVTARHGLVALLVFYAVLNFAVGFVDVLITPVVLGFAPEQALGTVLAVGGVGMVLGSGLMAAWGGPRRRVHGVLLFSLVLGVALGIGAVRESLVLIGAAAFVFLFCSAIINASNRSIWQAKVDPAMQGRVMSLEYMIATAPLPVAYLLAGPLADHVLRPLVASGGGFASAASALVGPGADRSRALLLLCAGLAVVVISVAGYLYPRLRRIDTELPDALPDRPVAAPAVR